MGTTIHKLTAYNPAANGVVERIYRILKAVLKSRYMEPNWRPQLFWVLLGLRTTPNEDHRISTEMVYGEALTIPGEFFPTTDTNNDLANLQCTIGNFHPCI